MVAIDSPNRPEYVVAFLAIAKAGGVVTTISPLFTSNELGKQLSHSKARFLVGLPDLIGKAKEAAHLSEIEEIYTFGEATGATPFESLLIDAQPPAVDIDPAVDLVVLPYSSGTTGLPKGVMLTHRNLVANLTQIDAAEQFDFRVLVGVLPFFHIYGMVVIMNLALMRGATAVTLPRFELEPFLKVLQDWRIELAHVVPPIAVALAKHPAVDAYDLRALKTLFSGAAPLGAELTEAVRQRLGATVRQGYGMTEASPATHYTGPAKERAGMGGLLLPSTECRIVDPETGCDVDVGERGEVWVRGPQVMKGYLDNAEATARTLDADGWLRTGDVGVIDPDGYLAIVDRLKELIKVKGFQVAPAELEALLLKHPGIADAAVIPVPDDDAGEVPKAFVVASGTITPEEVMAFVRAAVAHYKRVRYVELVDAIPKSPSGKILRRVLKAELRGRLAI